MYKQETILPYNEDGHKEEQVEQMFDNIAPSYDLLNHLLSWGIDKGWRRKAIDKLGEHHPSSILDIATGTGDFAILGAKRIKPTKVVGADISEGMMRIGRTKVQKEGLESIISFQREDCLHLSFDDNSFDAVTVAYGVRNFENLDEGLVEMHRVLKDGGHLLIVELASPPRFPMKQLFWLYSHIVMPLIGRLVSGDSRAYAYLPATMEAFPQGEVMEDILRKAGYRDIYWMRFTFGLCTMYLAKK